ncbi:MAG: DUF1640 domain-containing protein [Nitrospirae bacterium]|nr:DUF1640 domain-containing protein [Nitrospirota bacterium]
MASITFDTHTYVKKLKAVGFTEEQAEVQANALAELSDERLVTREYLDMRLSLLESRLNFKFIIVIAAIFLSNPKIFDFIGKIFSFVK